MTNELLINRFLNYQRREGKKVLTLSAYATDLRQFLSLLSFSALSSLSLTSLTTVCQKWTAGFSPNAAARKLTTLRLFLGWSYQKGYIKKDLSASVFRPKRQTMATAKPLTASQIVRLRRTATVQERLLLELILQTGMRLPEVLAIKMKHLKTARHSESAEGGRRIPSGSFATLRMTGRNSGIRIPISDILKQSLEYYLAAVTRGPRSYLLVSARTGRPPGARAAGMMLAKLGRRAGVKGVAPRNLRATCLAAKQKFII